MNSYPIIAIAAMAVGINAFSAEAACVHRVKSQSATISRHTALPTLPSNPAQPGLRDGKPIVGLWHVSHYLDDGSLYFESFEQYHADGTEFEFANINPIIGDICMGVWSQTTDLKTVNLYHIGWIFDDAGNPAGTFTLEGPRTTSQHRNHLEGTFDAKIYDVNGNLVEEDTGTTVGDRISAP